MNIFSTPITKQGMKETFEKYKLSLDLELALRDRGPDHTYFIPIKEGNHHLKLVGSFYQTNTYYDMTIHPIKRHYLSNKMVERIKKYSKKITDYKSKPRPRWLLSCFDRDDMGKVPILKVLDCGQAIFEQLERYLSETGTIEFGEYAPNFNLSIYNDSPMDKRTRQYLIQPSNTTVAFLDGQKKTLNHLAKYPDE